MNDYIDGDKAEGVRAWELPVVDEGGAKKFAIVQPKGTGPKQKRSIVPPTADELIAMQEAAEKEAREQGYREGHKEGLAKGYNDGLTQGQDEIKAKMQQLNDLINALAEPLAVLDEEMEEQFAQMCMTLAQQVIRREIKTQVGEVIAVVREALSVLPSSARNIRVIVNPEDAALLKETLASNPVDASWKIVEDPVQSRGGCQVITENSRIDATLEKRIASIAAQYLGDQREEDEDEDGQ